MLFSELDEQLDEINISNFDDIWNNFIPTPPQSPHLKLDQLDFSRFDEDLEENIDDFEQKLIHHDCMWSGQCSEGICNSMYNKPASTSCSMPETSLLSTSPISNFAYVPPYDMNAEPLNCFMEDVEEPSMDRNAYAMANDHSYESTSLIAPKDIKQELQDEVKAEKESSKLMTLI